ncbi:type II secretion system protein [Neobacillus sp. 3P2-tot-E-2]|uniref:type II secretion system protein n=1 Tax=Neobacillus sp. 3P2-tot-E-2 TaxID=3132212 RepID=UPI00399FBD15
MGQFIKNKLKEQKGLTLIELLAVIVILGIVAAIAVPSIMGIIDKSKKDAKVAEAIQIISAAKLEHATNSGITNWKKDAAAATTGASATPAYGGIGNSLSNVKDVSEDYEVNFNTSTKVYTIKNHDANSVVTGATTGVLTEQELIDYSN